MSQRQNSKKPMLTESADKEKYSKNIDTEKLEQEKQESIVSKGQKKGSGLQSHIRQKGPMRQNWRVPGTYIIIQ